MACANHMNADIMTSNDYITTKPYYPSLIVYNLQHICQGLLESITVDDTFNVTLDQSEKEDGLKTLRDGSIIQIDGAKDLLGKKTPISIRDVVHTIKGKVIYGKVSKK